MRYPKYPKPKKLNFINQDYLRFLLENENEDRTSGTELPVQNFRFRYALFSRLTFLISLLTTFVKISSLKNTLARGDGRLLISVPGHTVTDKSHTIPLHTPLFRCLALSFVECRRRLALNSPLTIILAS